MKAGYEVELDMADLEKQCAKFDALCGEVVSSWKPGYGPAGKLVAPEGGDAVLAA